MKEILKLHVAILLFGVSGIFGKVIDQPSEVVVSGRVIFASIFLFALLKRNNDSRVFKEKRYKKIIFFQGTILFLHWYTFFLGIKLSTVTLGLLSFSLFPVFTVFLEGFLLKENITKKNLFLAGVTVLGVFLVVPLEDTQKGIILGVFFGALSGFLFALLSVTNRSIVREVSGIRLTFYQCFGAALWGIPIFLKSISLIDFKSMSLLILLGVLFTGIAHSLFVSSLRKIKASTASIVACLEPIYGIVIAVIFLGEMITIKMILGSTIILISTILSIRYNKD